MSINDVTKVYSIGYMIEEVKVRFKKDVRAKILHMALNFKEDDTQTLPLWLAYIFQENGLAEIQGQDMDNELLQAEGRENTAGLEQIHQLKPDFYIRLNNFRDRTSTEREKFNVRMHDLVLLRLTKIINFARSVPLTPALQQKLTHEETKLFRLIHKVTKDFKECVLGDKQ